MDCASKHYISGLHIFTYKLMLPCETLSVGLTPLGHNVTKYSTLREKSCGESFKKLTFGNI